jgi:predicted AAA+ superfamily ATPase
MILSESSEVELFNFLDRCNSDSILVISGPRATGKTLLKILITTYLPVPVGVKYVEIVSSERVFSDGQNVFVINLMKPVTEMTPFSHIKDELLEYVKLRGVHV